MRTHHKQVAVYSVFLVDFHVSTAEVLYFYSALSADLLKRETTSHLTTRDVFVAEIYLSLILQLSAFNLAPPSPPSSLLPRSAVSGDDHEAEADWPAGAVPLFPGRGGGDLGAGLLPLQPAAGAQGDLQLREDAGGAVPGCQPDRGTPQGNTLKYFTLDHRGNNKL